MSDNFGSGSNELPRDENGELIVPPPIPISEYLTRRDEPQAHPDTHAARVAATHAKRNPFDPQNFDEYIGQEDVKKLVRIWIKAAKARNEPNLPHILITGEFGLGKTTLAKLIAREFTGKWHHPYDANKLDLFNIPTSGIIILDEIHNTAGAVQDSLNIRIDESKLLTIIGCTTDSGALKAPFRSRFRIVNLRPYSLPDLIEIITLDYQKRGNIVISPEQVVSIARRSRMNARQATQNLSMIFDLMTVNEEISLKDETLEEAFTLAGLDSFGFRPIDRLYLRALIANKNRPSGIQYLGSIIGADKSTIEEEIEPFLMRSGFIERQPRGRVITPNGIELIKSGKVKLE